jgi:hypothetical protein
MKNLSKNLEKYSKATENLKNRTLKNKKKKYNNLKVQFPSRLI